jgi:hypothetical protein
MNRTYNFKCEIYCQNKYKLMSEHYRLIFLFIYYVYTPFLLKPKD